ncbi:hypothetical protein FACS1894172_08170 [Spirochaetia bacterium]|nr:hypothetical protein FACS1894164_07770 [Spirochaetia bacterium]GHU32118.1 hypothetical protein FACS1894172_08170 [Spirochaetia bacterium]
MAIRLDPDNAGYYISRGNVYHNNKGDYDKAIADYSEAVRLEPRSAAHYAFRGNSYNTKKDYDRAIADLIVAITFSPDYQWAKDKLRDVFNTRGRLLT